MVERKINAFPKCDELI